MLFDVLQENMTPDGISTEDWDRIHVAVVDIVNASAVENDVLCAHHTQRLLDILDELEVTYGRIPSILDTRADYTDDPSLAIALYEEALAAAEDPDLTCLALPSLIRLMIEEHHDESSISRRILQLEQLADQEKGFELGKLQELQSNFEELKKQNKRCVATGVNIVHKIGD